MMVVSTISILNAGAQDWNWGSNEKKARECWSVLEQKLVESDYTGAKDACAWLLGNAPKLNVSLYIKASKVYENLVEQTEKLNAEDPKLKGLKDTALLVYDRRVLNFGDEAYVLDRKGMLAYEYYGKEKSQIDNLYTLYNKIVTLNGNKTTAVNFTYFMRVAVLKYRMNTLSKEEILKLYLNIEDLIDQEVKDFTSKGESSDMLERNRESIEKTFDKYVELSCDDLKLAYKSKFEAQASVDVAKKIFTTMASNKCTSDPLFIKATEYLISKEPEGKYYQVLSGVYFNQKEYNKSYSMYEKSLEITKDSAAKSDIYLSMAQIKYTQNDFSGARSNALKSIDFGKNYSNAYNLIGAMYESSYNTCKSESSVASKAVFIAAYEMYAKAGNTERMNVLHASFPTVEEMFMANTKEGDTFTVGCWINRSVTLRKK